MSSITPEESQRYLIAIGKQLSQNTQKSSSSIIRKAVQETLSKNTSGAERTEEKYFTASIDEELTPSIDAMRQLAKKVLQSAHNPDNLSEALIANEQISRALQMAQDEQLKNDLLPDQSIGLLHEDLQTLSEQWLTRLLSDPNSFENASLDPQLKQVSRQFLIEKWNNLRSSLSSLLPSIHIETEPQWNNPEICRKQFEQLANTLTWARENLQEESGILSWVEKNCTADDLSQLEQIRSRLTTLLTSVQNQPPSSTEAREALFQETYALAIKMMNQRFLDLSQKISELCETESITPEQKSFATRELASLQMELKANSSEPPPSLNDMSRCVSSLNKCILSLTSLKSSYEQVYDNTSTKMRADIEGIRRLKALDQIEDDDSQWANATENFLTQNATDHSNMKEMSQFWLPKISQQYQKAFQDELFNQQSAIETFQEQGVSLEGLPALSSLPSLTNIEDRGRFLRQRGNQCLDSFRQQLKLYVAPESFTHPEIRKFLQQFLQKTEVILPQPKSLGQMLWSIKYRGFDGPFDMERAKQAIPPFIEALRALDASLQNVASNINVPGYSEENFSAYFSILKRLDEKCFSDLYFRPKTCTNLLNIISGISYELTSLAPQLKKEIENAEAMKKVYLKEKQQELNDYVEQKRSALLPLLKYASEEQKSKALDPLYLLQGKISSLSLDSAEDFQNKMHSLEIVKACCLAQKTALTITHMIWKQAKEYEGIAVPQDIEVKFSALIDQSPPTNSLLDQTPPFKELADLFLDEIEQLRKFHKANMQRASVVLTNLKNLASLIKASHSTPTPEFLEKIDLLRSKLEKAEKRDLSSKDLQELIASFNDLQVEILQFLETHSSSRPKTSPPTPPENNQTPTAEPKISPSIEPTPTVLLMKEWDEIEKAACSPSDKNYENYAQSVASFVDQILDSDGRLTPKGALLCVDSLDLINKILVSALKVTRKKHKQVFQKAVKIKPAVDMLVVQNKPAELRDDKAIPNTKPGDFSSILPIRKEDEKKPPETKTPETKPIQPQQKPEASSSEKDIIAKSFPMKADQIHQIFSQIRPQLETQALRQQKSKKITSPLFPSFTFKCKYIHGGGTRLEIHNKLNEGSFKKAEKVVIAASSRLNEIGKSFVYLKPRNITSAAIPVAIVQEQIEKEARISQMANRDFASEDDSNVINAHLVRHEKNPSVAKGLLETLCDGDLSGITKNSSSYPMSTRIQIARDCANGLNSLHRAGFGHLDIKPENYLMKKNSSGQIRAYLSDFGVSEKLGAPTSGGTIGFMPPEVLIGTQKNSVTTTDSWALGLCLFQLFGGEQENPFSTLSNFNPSSSDWNAAYSLLIQKTTKLSCSPEIKKLIISLLNKNPQLRPSPKEARDLFDTLLTPSP